MLMNRALLSIFLCLFFANIVFGQVVGDYRSKTQSPQGTSVQWADAANWEYYNGSTWVAATNYPGQIAGTGAVLIKSGDVINISSALTTLSFGSLTITGKLVLNGDNSNDGMNFYLTTQSIVVTPSAGFIEFNNKLNLRLPANASLQVTNGGLDIASGCSANQVIYIGTAAYSKCNGGGSLPDFGNLMSNGGTLNPIITSKSSVCYNEVINLAGSFTGASGTTTSGGSTSGVNYSWSIQAPDASIQASSSQNYNFAASQTGNYSVTLTCTTYFGTTLYTNSKSVTVTVNPLPTLTVVNPAAVCSPSTVDITSASVQTTNTGTTNKYYSTLALANAGGASDITTPSAISSSGTYYIRSEYATGCYIVKSVIVTVNSLPNNVSNGFAATTICNGGNPQLTFNADDTTFSTPYSITYKNNATSIQYTVSISSSAATSFPIGDNPTSNTQYTLVSISNSTCTRAADFGDDGADLHVRPIPTATISGTTTVCKDASSPNITFTNPQTVAVLVTYTINGGSNQTIDIAASSSTNVSVSTAASGSFVYNLVSVVYKSNPTCSNTLSGSATVTVTAPLSGVSITPTGSQAICSDGSGPLLTVTGTGGGTITHQWGKRSVSGGTITPISSATGLIYTPLGSDLGVGTWYLVCISTPICGSAITSNEITVTVSSIPVAPTLSNITLACNQSTATETWTGISGISNYRFDVSLDSLFGTFLSGYNNKLIAGEVTSLDVNGLTPGITYYVRARSESSCGTSNNSSVASITVNSLPAAPTVTATTQPTCVVSTGSVDLSGLPVSGDIIQTGDVSASYTILGGGTQTILGLAPGNYHFAISNGSCSSTTVNVVMNAPVINTWDGTKWSKTGDATPPTSGDVIVFNGNYSLNSDIQGCSCQVNSGFTVTIPSGRTMTIANGVSNGGTLIFEDSASLIQINDAAVNTGDIIYKRVTAPMKNFDFTYWCSPVKDQFLKNLSPNTLWDKYYSFDNGGWKVKAYGNAQMEIAKGYIIRVPKPDVVYPNGEYWTGTTYAQPVQFVGVPNNGVVKIPVQGGGMDNLIGNPYPSALDADEFIKANTGIISGALRFWTHNTAITQNGSFYVYNPNDYVSYNLSGGIAANGLVTPEGKIAAGQSFFVTSTSTAVGDFVYNNAMRNTTKVLGSGGNSQFFRMSQTKKMAEIEKNRVWLNLTNADGIFKQLLVGYITGATDGIDNLYDAVSLDANVYADFYSINSGKNLVIQGFALPFEEIDQVPLGYKTTVQGSFTISIGKTDGVLADQSIFIEDKVTGAIANLKNGPYTFSTATGVFNNRFILRFIAKNTSRIASKTAYGTLDNSVLVSVKSKQININSHDGMIDQVMIYDLKTSLLYKNENVNTNEFTVPNFNSADQFLIVQVLLKNGKWVTKEIVL